MRYIYRVLPVLFALLFISGCSPMSSTQRYSEKKETPKQSQETVRYQEQKTPDTLYTYSEDEDPEFTNQPQNNSYSIADAFSTLPPDNTEQNSFLAINLKDQFIMEIIKYQNTPYKFGGNNEDGIDCSAFTQNVFQEAGKIQLHRTARDQYTQGVVIGSKTELVFGDLVFFDTRRRVKPGHVGIYIANGLFAHASSKHGVIVSSLEQDYYNRKYMGARRVFSEK